MHFKTLTEIILLVGIILNGCFNSEISSNTVGGHCWENGKLEEDYTIYLEENDCKVPYLIIENNYNGSGNCLLLRKYILDEPMPYNENGMNGSYYAESTIDSFLDNNFIEVFGDNKDFIVESTISIVTEETLGIPINSQKSETINRRVFLLSQREVWGHGSYDGIEIPWFRENTNRSGFYLNGVSGSWVLRTCAGGGSDLICAVGPDGSEESGGLGGIAGDARYDNMYTFGIRPAICIGSNTPVKYIDGFLCLGDKN